MSLPHLTVIDHPLARHLLTRLRDKTTPPEQFRATARRLAYPLVLEATRDLPLREVTVTTPLDIAEGAVLAEALVVIPVLRAGLGLLEAVTDVFPEATVGYAGLARDEETALPHRYYLKLPPLHGRRALVLEPMLATGGSLSETVTLVKEAGGSAITAVCVVAAPEGVARMTADHPDVRIVCAALDDGLTSNFYITPGLGDMGDRLFGT